MNSLEDSFARERFITEWQRNFSVIAPAGVGKTTAITERIVHMATDGRGKEFLGELVVVTYTRKAAAEIRLRIREKLRQMGNRAAEQSLGRAFFGTIDGFYSFLVKEFGKNVGQGTAAQVVAIGDELETALWQDFLENNDWSSPLPGDLLDKLLRLCPWSTLAELARRAVPVDGGDNSLPDAFPKIEWEKIFPSNPGEEEKLPKNLRDQLQVIASWRTSHEKGNFAPLRLPEKWSTRPLRGTPFAELCVAHWLRPLSNWVEVVGGFFCNRLAMRYRDHRLANGLATYDDMRHLARGLLENPSVLRELRERNYRVLIDEAQDTAPEDFSFFLRLVPGECDSPKPLQGHFSLVGDGQQSIYARDAEAFGRFAELLENLKKSETAEELTFSVTMRCPRAVVSCINAHFPRVFSGEKQAAFVPMTARPGAAMGGVHALPLAVEREGKLSTISEMEAIARYFSEKSPGDFGAGKWGDIAILCGLRKAQLRVFRRILAAEGVPCQLRLRGNCWNSHLLFRWLCGILRIFLVPTDAVEAVFVLREIFEVDDGTIAKFLRRFGQETIARLLLGEKYDGATGEDFPSITDPLELLAEVRNQLQNSKIVAALESIDGAVRLLERARRCEPECWMAHERLWKSLLYFAEEGEAGGSSLAGFFASLRKKFFEPCEPDAADDRCIQLDNLHGSKGLEWPVVILPFCRHAVSSRSEYPPIFTVHGKQPRLLLTPHGDAYGAFRSRQPDDELRNLQRLSYVAMTRTKNTLILSYDRGNEEPGILSPEKIMGIDLEKLPLWQPCAVVDGLPFREELAFANALEPGNQFGIDAEEISAVPPQIRRPAVAGRREEIIPKERQNASTDYGIWWHRTMQLFPWEDKEARGLYLSNAPEKSPDPQRARGELNAFLHSRWLREHGEGLWKFFPEWTMEVMEGVFPPRRSVIDLLCVDGETGAIEILDWKTEFIRREDVNDAIAFHANQLRHYEALLQQFEKCPVKLAVYFSGLGEHFSP
ncbi:MAG: UvrD-helicase domain-containing protein [Puniceicoccales bacterium]|nr:UvrD-helicase domain-containing protein [Puniceicoccales bacterium]